jgi:hypothetical protein
MSKLIIDSVIAQGANQPSAIVKAGELGEVARFFSNASGNSNSLFTITDSVQTIDFTNGAVVLATYADSFSGSCAFTLNFGSVSGVYILVLRQNATGFCEATFTNTIAWSNGAAPELSTNALVYDILTFTNINGVVTLATSQLDLY